MHFSMQIRAAVVAAMMPAAIWSGVQAPECVCSNGEHRFFCPHLLSVAGSNRDDASFVNTKASCCNWEKQPASCEAPKLQCQLGLHDVANPPCSHCVAVPNSTPSVVDRVEAPSMNHVEWFTPSTADDQATLAALVANDRARPASDRLPLTDRVIVLCCLLI